ncbi:MAG: PEP-CTERM sorting domain-containing protein [Sedimentisphaerales bacterium]|nr:PEP-CTERM sorting domain-containing protein [Sedimentisphaerales bacterium]
MKRKCNHCIGKVLAVIVSLSAIASMATVVQATTIPVENPGFEALSGFHAGQFPGWTLDLGSCGTGGSDSVLTGATGNSVGYAIAAGVFHQGLGFAIQPGTYTLTVDVGDVFVDADPPFDPLFPTIPAVILTGNSGTVELTEVSRDRPTPDNGQMLTWTTVFSVAPGDAIIGSDLWVVLGAFGETSPMREIVFDEVSIDYVPEPATLVLFSLGMLGVLRKK